MTKHRSILVAIDSSDEASDVLAAAKDIAGDSGAALSLVTVITPVNYAYGPEYGMVASATVNIEQEAAEIAKRAQVDLETKHDVRCEKSVIIGQPAHEIRQLAKDGGADLIVIGSHGRHGLGLLLGSTVHPVMYTLCG